jgi:L-iditol 2-dehydrogenase
LEAPIVRVNPKNYIEAYALAEPVGCVIHGIEFSQVESTNRLLILGGGPIGIMLIKVCLDLIGIPKHQITVIEPFSSRRNFVLGMGIDAFPSIIDLPKVGNRLFDRIFTATSNPTSHDGIFEFIEKGGRVNFFGGVPKNSSQIQLDANLLHYSEISLEGSHGSSPRHHEKATNLISLDEEFWAKLITTKTSLHGLPSAISRMRQGLELKVAVDFKNGS